MTHYKKILEAWEIALQLVQKLEGYKFLGLRELTKDITFMFLSPPNGVEFHGTADKESLLEEFLRLCQLAEIKEEEVPKPNFEDFVIEDLEAWNYEKNRLQLCVARAAGHLGQALIKTIHILYYAEGVKYF